MVRLNSEIREFNTVMAAESKLHHVYMSFRENVTKMVASIVPSKEVEDILQETYIRICQLPEPESIEKPKSFLYTTARNLALDHLKRAETRLSDPFQEEVDSHELSDTTFEQAVTQKEFSIFCESVKALPQQCRRVFVLKKVYGYSQREIAQLMKISQSTVEKHIATGVKKCTLLMYQHRFATTRLAGKSINHHVITATGTLRNHSVCLNNTDQDRDVSLGKDRQS